MCFIKNTPLLVDCLWSYYRVWCYQERQ